MKFMENLKKKKANNKGFSLVELIIVIAIMAILVGIVGTQVIPYLERSREAKDQQILSSLNTAAVTAYTLNAEAVGTGKVVVTIDTTAKVTDPASPTDAQKKIATDIVEFFGYDAIASLDWSSTEGKSATKILITIDAGTNKTVTVQAYKDDTAVLDPVTSNF